MTPTDLLIPAISFILGLVAAYLFFRQQISATKGGHELISNAGSTNARVQSRMEEMFLIKNHGAGHCSKHR
jgi:hypothetical protein